jgi:hypothetical protein
MREREEVLREFYRADAFWSSVDMADEIVRLREALAAATRDTYVTEAMADAAFQSFVHCVYTFGVLELTAAEEDSIRGGIRSAITAALEVPRD